MLKTVLAAVNARYIHSCLALYSLRASCPRYRDSIFIREFTINQERGFILRELYSMKPDIIGFSCYIWNIEMVASLTIELKKLMPSLIIILGGPEVSHERTDCPADIIVSGEGERAFNDIMAFYNEKRGRVLPVMDGEVDINRLPFPYADGLAGFENRIIYYESSRGCPFRCQYCLSGSEDHHVRALPLERVRGELQFFLDDNVRQVKFIDRTFNCLEARAANIWRFLKEHDNGVTNFHFEISADLLDSESLELLAGVRKGTFQFEIGVQSTNISVLKEIGRKTDIARLSANVSALREPRNIHLHLDLIAGLPGEGYESFGRSFNDVYAMKPDMLQLGFLKALKGTGLRNNAARWGLVYGDSPPYEVLKTNALSFDEICRLKDIEYLLESFYNTGLAPFTLRYLTRGGAFEFYESLAAFWRGRGYHLAPRGKIAMYAALYEYCLENAGVDAPLALELMGFDLLARENEKSPPEWLAPKLSVEDRALFRRYKASMGADAIAVRTFEYDIAGWVSETPEKRRNALLFRYKDGKGRGEYSEITGGN
ncbi:MAG: B12-binding domain-containing radical SAM protein, partial [Clostridiales bacterium]|nr:B12-binding domain-containing radical SAM protein [Clostridiales bacterium]